MGSSASKKTEAIKEPSSSSSSSSSRGGSKSSNDRVAQGEAKAVVGNSQAAMPFFRKQSEGAKKRLQHQQYLVSYSDL